MKSFWLSSALKGFRLWSSSICRWKVSRYFREGEGIQITEDVRCGKLCGLYLAVRNLWLSLGFRRHIFNMVFIWNTKGMLNVWSIIKSHFKKQLRHSTSLRFTVFIRLVRDIDVFLLGCYFFFLRRKVNRQHTHTGNGDKGIISHNLPLFWQWLFFLSIFFIKIFYFTMLGSNFKWSNIYIYIYLYTMFQSNKESIIFTNITFTLAWKIFIDLIISIYLWIVTVWIYWSVTLIKGGEGKRFLEALCY